MDNEPVESNSIKHVLAAINELSSIASEATADGKVSYGDITLLPATITALQKLVEHWEAAKKEFANVDEQTAQLIAWNLVNAYFKLK